MAASETCASCRFCATGTFERTKLKLIRRHWWSSGTYEPVPVGIEQWWECRRYPRSEDTYPDDWCGEYEQGQPPCGGQG